MTFQIQTVSDIQRKNNIFRQKNDIKKGLSKKIAPFAIVYFGKSIILPLPKKQTL